MRRCAALFPLLILPLLTLQLWAGDLAGMWIAGSGTSTPMCLALSQRGQGVTGNIAYDKDRKFAEIQNGKVNGDEFEFTVEDRDHGTMRFRFTVAEGSDT